MRFAVGALCLLVLAFPAFAADTPSGLPVPRFVSLKFVEVNGRAGPSDQHPIVWTYHRKGLPMLVVAETENWRRVQDPDGETVWVHRRLLDGRHTAIAVEEAALLVRPEPGAGARAIVEPGVVVQVQSCRDRWVRVTAEDHTGWADAGAFWGADCGGATTADAALRAGLEQ